MMPTSREYQNNKTDIVIVTFKSYKYLEKCITSLYDDVFSRRFIQDIIVVDNAPEGAYWNSPPKAFEKVVVLRNGTNIGFGCAANVGIRRGSAPYVLLLNPDTIIHKGMVARAVAFMDQHPGVGVMGPKILNEDGSLQGSARGFPNYSALLFGRASPLNTVFPGNPWTKKNIPCYYMKDDEQNFHRVDWVSGAAAVIRRKAIEEIGYFDRRFFMYWEDADLCQRMRKAGWDVVYYPCPEVTHLLEKCTEQNFILNLARFHKSAFLLERKQKRNRWPGHMVLVAFALEFHFLARLLWRAVQGRTERGRTILRDKIKVLRIIARLNIGGPAIHVALLTRGLDPARFESILVTGQVSPQEGDMSYIVDGLKQKLIVIPELQRDLDPIKDVKSFFRVLRFIGNEKPDIVHTHTAKAGTIGRVAVFVHNLIHRRNVCVVHTFHGHVFRGYFGRLKSQFFVLAERLLARITDLIIAISETQKGELCSDYHIAPTSKFRTVKLGFDLKPFFSAGPVKGQFRRSLGVDSNTILVGIVGRLVPVKNHKMFLESARIFLHKNPDVRAKFVVIGDGELRNDLIKYCKQEQLCDHVLFCGWKRGLPEVYADIDILTLTSINEGTPVSLIEAMACSVPVISTGAGGVRDLLGVPLQRMSSNGFQVYERGILCRQGDPEALAMGLEHMIRNGDPREHMVKSGRFFVEESFSKERLLYDIESIYHELMAKGT